MSAFQYFSNEQTLLKNRAKQARGATCVFPALAFVLTAFAGKRRRRWALQRRLEDCGLKVVSRPIERAVSAVHQMERPVLKPLTNRSIV